jgi:hypothetical protein
MIASKLFVGGHFDGQWLNVQYNEFEKLPEQWIVAIRPKIKMAEWKPEESEITTNIERVIYRRMDWQVLEYKRTIYVLSELSGQRVLDLLIQNYRPVTK